MSLGDGKNARVQVLVGKGEKDEFELEVQDPEILRIDGFASGGCQVTALKEGSTDILLKNRVDGQIWKRHHVTITTPAYSKIKASNPRHHRVNQKQLTKGDTYDLEVEMFTKHDMKIYPSENILSVMDASDSLSSEHFEDNRLLAKVTVLATGYMNVSNTLKSIKGDDDKEYEILPHVHSKTTFEAWHPLDLAPEEYLLPWDANVKPSYSLVYKVRGGDDKYRFNISDSTLASSDQNTTESYNGANNIKLGESMHQAVVSTHSGPGTFEVVAYMPRNPEDNQDNGTVHILPVSRIDFNPRDQCVEFLTSSDIRLTLKMTTQLLNETAMFHQCHEVPYEVVVSDEDNFKAVKTTGRTAIHYGDGRRSMKEKRELYESSQECTDFKILQLSQKPGLLAEVGIKYEEPLSGKVLRARRVISTFDGLKVLHPEPKNQKPSKLVLPVGSSSDVVFKGGPLPWKKLFGKQANHFKNISIDGEEYDSDKSTNFLKVIRNEVGSKDDTDETLIDDNETINDLHVYTITCLSEGRGSVRLTVGNEKDLSLEWEPVTGSAEINVVCNIPNKLTLRIMGEGIVHDTKGNILADFTKDIKIALTLKDKNGNTFETIESIEVDRRLSDETLIDSAKTATGFVIPKTQFKDYDNIKLPGKPYQILVPSGKEGTLEISLRLSGYNEESLKKNGIKNAPPLPTVSEDKDYDEEDEEEYIEHNHDLIQHLTIKLVSPQQIKEINTV